MSDLKDFIIKNTLLEKYIGEDTEVTIPECVTTIGRGAFSGCTHIKSIIIPNSIVKIGSIAFDECTQLTTVTIPDSVADISYTAFQGCTNLVSVVIPTGVTNISINPLPRYGVESTSVFNLCPNLEEIVFPSEITNFEGSVMELFLTTHNKAEAKPVILYSIVKYCPLSVLNSSKVVKTIKSNKAKILDLAAKQDCALAVEKLFSLYKAIPFDEIDSYIQKYSANTTITAFLLNYKNQQFPQQYQEKFEEINTEKSFGIKEYTLSDLKKIFSFKKTEDGVVITAYKGNDTEVIIPDKIGENTVVEIDGAFKSNNEITNVFMPNTIKKIGANTFEGCDNLSNIVISNSLKVIGEGAFSNCKKLLSVNLPNSLKEIQSKAFNDCGLQNISIPKNCKKIGIDAFACCDALTDDNGFFTHENRLFWVRSDIEEFAIPENICLIDDEALNRRMVTNYSDTYHQVTINGLSFLAEKRSSIVIPESITEIPDGKQEYSYFQSSAYYSGCFAEIENLIEVCLHQNIKKIGAHAFFKCKNLENISLPEGLKIIGEGAFEKTALRSVKIPSTVTIISGKAFSGCTKLESVFISEGVKKIEDEAFAKCSALKEIYIPASVTRIADTAITINKNKKIIAKFGSYAEKFAKKHNIPFVAE